MAEAAPLLRQHLQLLPGYAVSWSGEYEAARRVKERLLLAVSLTLLLILLLLYLNTRSLTKTMIVLLAVPFSAIGAIWILFLLGYNLSAAAVCAGSAGRLGGSPDGSGSAGRNAGGGQTPDVTRHPACPHCGMDREKFAHSRILTYRDGSESGTCSLHCAALELAVRLDKTPTAIQVADFNTLRLLDAEKAAWVIGEAKPGMMTPGGQMGF